MIQLIARLQRARPVGPSLPVSDPGPEQRTTRRTLSLFWSATLKAIGWTGPATVVDISSGGMRLRSTLKPTAGTQVVVELPGVAPLRGHVRWADGDRFGVELDSEIDVVKIMRDHRSATGSHLGVDRSV